MLACIRIIILVVIVCSRSVYALLGPKPPSLQPRVGNSPKTSSISIKALQRNAVNVPLLGRAGVVGSVSKDDLVLLQTFSGVKDDDGSEVIGVLPLNQFKKGERVSVNEDFLAPKPPNLSWESASALPFLSIHCMTALCRSGFVAEAAEGKTCMVTGSGQVSLFAGALLSSWGADVSLITTAGGDVKKKAGAKEVIDFRNENFSNKLMIDLVVDTLGRETEGSAVELRKARGATYISIMPDILKTAIDEGILFGSGKILGYRNALKSTAAGGLYWMPSSTAMNMVRAVVDLAISGKINLKNVLGENGSGAVTVQDYLEAISWPKDTDTGLRYGFPGKTGEFWNGSGYDLEEEELEYDMPTSRPDDSETVLRLPRRQVPSYQSVGGGVTEVYNMEDIMKALEGGKGALYVSSSSCRVCKFLRPFYVKQQPAFEDVKFLHMNANSNPRLVSEDLEVSAVPSFVSFKGGRRLRTLTSSDKEKITRLLQEVSE